MDAACLQGKKILLVKLRYIGDTLSLVPVINNLNSKTSGAIVDVMVNKGTEEVLLHHPGICRLWIYDREAAKKNYLTSICYHKELIENIRLVKYDYVIDFTHGDRAAFLCFMTGASERITYENSSTISHLLMNRFILCDPFRFHIVDYQLQALRYFGMNQFKRDVTLFVPQEVESKVEGMLRSTMIPPGSPLIVIHPGARGRLRQWRPERFGEICRRLKETYDAGIALIGGPNESELVRDVERCMGFGAPFRSTDLGLLEMAALMKKAILFLGNDSAPGHIAAAVKTPTITLFGPTFPHMWGPLNPAGECLFKHAACCGCRQEICIRPESTCMDLIETDEVWDKVRDVLSKGLQLK